MSEWLSKENECKNIGPWSEGGAEAMLSLLLVFCLFFFFFFGCSFNVEEEIPES